MIDELIKLIEELRANGYEAGHITSTAIGKPIVDSAVGHNISIRVKSVVMLPIIEVDREKV